jgi:hypothetical protein
MNLDELRWQSAPYMHPDLAPILVGVFYCQIWISAILVKCMYSQYTQYTCTLGVIHLVFFQ